ncbi:MAG TPA: DUF2007 domain-containing protein [bacterium]|nr:MAG: hypothetical protein BWY28_01837 [bacterium ADurb.Bin236]HOY63605.1 DUF2007 domain-containing protein [bacterium]HPI78533.1 DUF2007 domain-containing protein [bacterium]HPN93631.1 DUF2007 domain-containing protein [bacterium]
MKHDQKNEPVVIYRTSDYFDANIIKGVLETNGIQSFLSGTPMSHCLDVARHFGAVDIRINVREQDAETALKIINESQAP